MNESKAPVFAFKTHQEAENAIQFLVSSGFEATQLSLVSKGHRSENDSVNLEAGGEHEKLQGSAGAMWDDLRDLLLSPVALQSFATDKRVVGEHPLKVDNFMLMVYGTAATAQQARVLLLETRALEAV